MDILNSAEIEALPAPRATQRLDKLLELSLDRLEIILRFRVDEETGNWQGSAPKNQSSINLLRLQAHVAAQVIDRCLGAVSQRSQPVATIGQQNIQVNVISERARELVEAVLNGKLT